ncbi:MAG: hypothetical protein ABI778_10100, partial [Ignavibacteriota bacterium]
RELSSAAIPYLSGNIKFIVFGTLGFAVGMTIFYAAPLVSAKEKLLGDVRDVRNNSNDGIKWIGKELPPDSRVLVTAPSLYGLGAADEMTSKDDRYKLYAQYTFLQGYIRSYFRALGRNDIALGYLEDSTMLSQVLDSCRSQGNYYLFLQTGLDADRFHSMINNSTPLCARDSLVAKFTKGPYPAEVWILR